MTTVKQYRLGTTLESPIYSYDPYVIINKDNVVLWAGELYELERDSCLKGSYYENCTIKIREYDLEHTDNTRVGYITPKVNRLSYEIGLTIIIDDSNKSRGVIIGKCTYTPTWSNEETLNGYIVEVWNNFYNTSAIVVHPDNILKIVEES